MSCSSSSAQVSRAGAVSGLTGLSGKLGYSSGQLLAQATRTLDRAGQAAAPVSRLALNVLEPRGTSAGRKRAAAGLLAGMGLRAGTRLAGVSLPLGKIKLAAKAGQVTTGAIGGALADLTDTGRAGQVTTEQRRFFGLVKSTQQTEFRHSGLTSWLNRQNVIGHRRMTASSGATFRAGGATWHRGTISFEVEGQPRTITKLQSLSYPAESYYFDRALSNRQAVAIAAGQARPDTTPGYAGHVGKLESLTPTWAGLKRSLILTQLHWGGRGQGTGVRG